MNISNFRKFKAIILIRKFVIWTLFNIFRKAIVKDLKEAIEFKRNILKFFGKLENINKKNDGDIIGS